MAAPRPLPLSELPKDIAALIERDGPLCVWCSRRLGLSHQDGTREHVVPRSRGGKNTLDNYLLACRPCNRSRRSRDARAWLAICERRGLASQRALVEAALTRISEGDVVKPSQLSRRASRLRRRARRHPGVVSGSER